VSACVVCAVPAIGWFHRVGFCRDAEHIEEAVMTAFGESRPAVEAFLAHARLERAAAAAAQVLELDADGTVTSVEQAERVAEDPS